MTQNLVIVESPAKAKTIEKYLGKDFHVLASYGHIRDLPSKDGSVDPDHDFEMTWANTTNATKAVSAIVKAAKAADQIYLATDPDREGEAISWHVLKVLEEKKALKNKPVSRIIFHEITKNAVKESLDNPREINMEMVDAYLARRALDYLVGFNISPVLWRKLPGSKSAGRVQSVALRLITERDREIECFIPKEYWSIHVDCLTAKDKPFTARLVSVDGKKLDKLSIEDKPAATALVNQLKGQDLTIQSIEKKQVKRHPQPPFTTSTLQQEAARKLRFSASQTMRLAQKLYEGIDIGGETTGLITYMRTDSITLSNEALTGVRQYIQTNFEAPYLPKSPRAYKSKVKNAQEAHEAIRPTSFMRPPESLAAYLDGQQLKLYRLIWQRAVASQMSSALKDQMAVDIMTADSKLGLRANGSRLAFDGFLKVYEEGQDTEVDDKDITLPEMAEKEQVTQKEIHPEQHFTQPPARYSEASLVKKLEELGIGRPSTYAAIIQVLQARKYVRLESRRFFAEDRGHLVATFLKKYFAQYVEYDFTAKLEEQLDSISRGEVAYKNVLSDFWTAFHQAVDETKPLKISDVLDMLDEQLEYHFFKGDDMEKARACPKCDDGTLRLKIGRYGAFIGCGNYPECTHIQRIGENDTPESADEAAGSEGDSPAKVDDYPKELGPNEAGDMITLRKGPYGFYVQIDAKNQKGKPKRAGLPKGKSPASFTLEEAKTLLSLPKVLGTHPETGAEIDAGIGRYGPYVKMDKKFYTVKNKSIFDLTLEEAVEIIASSKKK